MKDTYKTNGTYLLESGTKGQSNGTSIVYVSGVFGTATATLKYLDDTGAFVSLTDGILTADEQYTVDHGIGENIYLEIASADGSTAIAITVAGKV